jgi:hypothetical protein
VKSKALALDALPKLKLWTPYQVEDSVKKKWERGVFQREKLLLTIISD